MPKDHLKRLAAPKSWPLLRKANTFVTRPNPGRTFDLAISLNNVLIDLLNKSKSRKESRSILHNKQVFINGKREYNHRRPIGVLDVISLLDIKEHYIITLTKQGKLSATSISEEESKKHLVKIKNKTVTKGKTQINCTDGTNILLDKNQYSTGDTLVLQKGKISKHLALKEGSIILLTGGKYLAKIGVVKSVEEKNIVFEVEKKELSTAKRYAFVLGEGKSEVTIQ